MSTTKNKRELDLSAFPPGSVTEYSTLVCLACTFDIFTIQLGLAPRTAYSEIKKYCPTIAELTAPKAIPPFFDSEEKHPHCPYCNAAKRWHARLDTFRVAGGKATDAARRKLIKSLPQKDNQFQFIDSKTDKRAVFFDWLRLFLAPVIYSEVLIVQYLVSRSHVHGGRTLEGRLTLPELIGRLRYGGYLDSKGISQGDQFEILEQLIETVAGGPGSIKVYYIVDRRGFLEKAKSVYARYAA